MSSTHQCHSKGKINIRVRGFVAEELRLEEGSGSPMTAAINISNMGVWVREYAIPLKSANQKVGYIYINNNILHKICKTSHKVGIENLGNAGKYLVLRAKERWHSITDETFL